MWEFFLRNDADEERATVVGLSATRFTHRLLCATYGHGDFSSTTVAKSSGKGKEIVASSD